ncbi:hypothetical protein [Rhizobium sp. Root564]|uniref:hypothetical protein n=1 Tax=Agrobacterium cavarae TaxID=2528239 RepID=UPI00071405FA|nr:hypothetical protein ASD74_00290 [Rhizobium sp. Root564]
MKKHIIEQALAGVLEDLADAEHQRWTHWQSYVHSQGVRQPDGSLIIPAELVSRWDRETKTVYSELTEQEKESDREQVRRYLPIVINALAKYKD